MALVISKTEKDLLELLTADTETVNEDGVEVDYDGTGASNTAYADTVVPIPNYTTLVEGAEDKVSDGLRLAALSAVRHMGPIAFMSQDTSVSPSLATTGTSNLSVLAYTIPTADQLKVARQVQVSVNLSAYSTTTDVLMEYWVDINGVESAKLRYFFNESGSHRSAGGNWIMTLPAGAATITVKVKNSSGTGPVNLDSSDCVSLTIIG